MTATPVARAISARNAAKNAAGANSFVTKPASLLCRIGHIRALSDFRFGLAGTPNGPGVPR